jgi:tripartite-type tricarboxylate transporter receptor subunit TctC
MPSRDFHHDTALPPLSRRHLLAGTGAMALSGLLPATALAQDAWPTRPIRFVVPFAPGGSSEIVARSTAAELSKTLGQNVFVDNKPGAAGNIAMQEVARADDQHRHPGPHRHPGRQSLHLRQAALRRQQGLQPVSLLAKVPSLYVVHPDVPVKNLRELIAYAKKKPGQLSYGSAGNGSAGHLAFEYLKMTAEIFMLHVPYRGTGPMMTDLMSGRLDAASVGAAALLPFIKAGKVRCIATGSTQRLPQLPDVPTVAEQGFPGFEMTQWYGMLAPSNMTRAHVDKLAAECAKAVKAPDALKRLQGDAAEPIGSTPQQFAQFIAAEQGRWQKVLKRAQVKPD